MLCHALASLAACGREALPRPDLRQYATACGSVRYLAIPFRLSRDEAEACSRYYGGVPACPATMEEFQALYDYLAPLMYREHYHVSTYYHLGIVPDPEQGALHWLSGAPYRWQSWSRPMPIVPTTAATPFIAMLDSASISRWWWHPDPYARFYTVMQWEG